jgi:hypothetical protein
LPGWQGVGAPKNTPIEIIDKLHREINAAPADDKMAVSISAALQTRLYGEQSTDIKYLPTSVAPGCVKRVQQVQRRCP